MHVQTSFAFSERLCLTCLYALSSYIFLLYKLSHLMKIDCITYQTQSFYKYKDVRTFISISTTIPVNATRKLVNNCSASLENMLDDFSTKFLENDASGFILIILTLIFIFFFKFKIRNNLFNFILHVCNDDFCCF